MKDKVNIPDVCIDENGYPTVEYLEFIKDYNYEVLPIMDMVNLICNNWEHGSVEYDIKDDTLELHTLGWSGNEKVMEAILSNMWLTHLKMKYVKWEVGGHYYFELRG